VYWDEALESFGLRVHPSGRRVYVCAYRVNQRKRLATLGRADALSLDQPRKKAMTYLAKAANHEDPQADSDEQRQLKTVAELVSAYVENHTRKNKENLEAGRVGAAPAHSAHPECPAQSHHKPPAAVMTHAPVAPLASE
jgi:Arm domain-containing DNA-binding protein